MASKRPPTTPTSSANGDFGESSSKRSRVDDPFDGMDDASLMEALEEEELMMANAEGRPHPQTTPSSSRQAAAPVEDPMCISGNPMRREWPRPPPPPIDPASDTISFQQIDIDHYVAPPIPGMPGLQSGVVPVLRMYGVTMEGNSVCAHLHGFLPYFYVNYPREDFAAEHCSDFRTSLNDAVLGDMKSNRDNITTAVVSVEICQR